VNQLVDILKMVKSLPPDAADLSRYLDRLIKDWIIEAVRVRSVHGLACGWSQSNLACIMQCQATGKEISDADIDAMCNSIQDVFKSEPVNQTMRRIIQREREHPSEFVKVKRRVPVKNAKPQKPKKKKKKVLSVCHVTRPRPNTRTRDR